MDRVTAGTVPVGSWIGTDDGDAIIESRQTAGDVVRLRCRNVDGRIIDLRFERREWVDCVLPASNATVADLYVRGTTRGQS